jgi:hypothetical protein
LIAFFFFFFFNFPLFLVCIDRRLKRIKQKGSITYWKRLKLATDSPWSWWHELLTLARTSAQTGNVVVTEVELLGTWQQVGASPLESGQTQVPVLALPITSPLTVGKIFSLLCLSFFILWIGNNHNTCLWRLSRES